MIVVSPQVMVTAKPEPKAWDYQGRSGVTYKVQVSDGQNSMTLKCDSAEVYNKFQPFISCILQLELFQVNTEYGLSNRLIVKDVQPVNQKG